MDRVAKESAEFTTWRGVAAASTAVVARKSVPMSGSPSKRLKGTRYSGGGGDHEPGTDRPLRNEASGGRLASKEGRNGLVRWRKGNNKHSAARRFVKEAAHDSVGYRQDVFRQRPLPHW